MSSLLWRLIYAVIVVLIVYALVPPVCRLLGFPLDGDVLTILRVCVGGLALLYVLFGDRYLPA